ncbi:oxysterol-binding protein-related protein 4B isoform X1 [Selaginella moellendorffii]|nr:oxysterol-binding protein-related protein 4B isoform X1 [Selaginella moellendorffii]|eukprot:XP_002969003.2 oxysterol-binding protein-related protein 4B isoform X1 [Selaginella moellendorffii]
MSLELCSSMGLLGFFQQATDHDPAPAAEDRPRPRMPVLTPPLQLEASDSSPGGDDAKSATSRIGGIGRYLDLFKGMGADLSRFQVPVHLNFPKSQLQLYGEMVYCFTQDILSQCADAATPMDRFLHALRWHISATRQPHFGKAPYNPILGETHHASVGDLNVLLEQVSHHPPVSALYATNEKKGFQLRFWHHASPRFYGSGVDITIHGRRLLKLERHGESYEMTSPKLGFRFLPVPGTDWSGSTTVSCAETGLKATIVYKNKGFFGLHGSSRRIGGKVWDTNTGNTLYEIHGNWDQFVYLKESSSGTTSTLYDARAVVGKLRPPQVKNLNAISPMESTLVWSGVSEGILTREVDKARAAKLCVEESQRALRKERQALGIKWSPKFFTLSAETGDWEWQHPEHPVPPAPLVVPLP